MGRPGDDEVGVAGGDGGGGGSEAQPGVRCPGYRRDGSADHRDACEQHDPGCAEDVGEELRAHACFNRAL